MNYQDSIWEAFLVRLRRWQTFWREFAHDRVAVASLIVVIVVAMLGAAAPWLPLHGPTEFTEDQYTSPSFTHPMGTDNFGRSMLSRVIWGGRLGLAVGIGSAGISMLLGIALGAISGYFGGWIDDLLSRTFDIFLLIPAFFLAMLIIALFGPSIYFIMLVIGLTMWPRSARIMRAQALTLKNRTFIQATRVSGATHLQALFRHVIPNGLAPVITHGTILMGTAILIEAGLSFLGLGDPNTVSWGRMIFEGQQHLRVAPWMSFFPGLAMLLVVTALNLVGDGLNYAVNPQLRAPAAPAQLPDPEEETIAAVSTDAGLEQDEYWAREPMMAEVRNPGPLGAESYVEAETTESVPQRDGSLILDAQDLKMYYALEDAWLHSVDGVTIQLKRGESLGLVGESGCGKTSVGITLMRVLPRNARIVKGELYLGGDSVLHISEKQFQTVRWNRISMIFQSSMNALNPVKRVGEQLVEAYQLHQPHATEREALERAKALFDAVNISTSWIRSYPHELSGGMRQRVMIALALLLEPEVIIADEPTTALDVLVQDQILAELERLRDDLDLSMILISHDMGIVSETCDRIAVMYAGQIVEEAPSAELFRDSRHPYTRGLLGSLPSLTGPMRELVVLPGESTPTVGETRGCRFASRCPLATDLCHNVDPPFIPVSKGHWSRCHYALEDKVETAWSEGET